MTGFKLTIIEDVNLATYKSKSTKLFKFTLTKQKPEVAPSSDTRGENSHEMGYKSGDTSNVSMPDHYFLYSGVWSIFS